MLLSWRNRGLAVAVGCLIPVIAAARAEDPAVRKALESDYARMAAAMKKKDSNALTLFAAPDFVLKGQGQPDETAAQVRKDLTGQFSQTRSMDRFTMTMLKLDVSRTHADSSVTVVMRAVMLDVHGKPHTITDSAVERDSWIKTAKGWRLRVSERSQEQASVDGKALPRGR